MEHFKVYRLLGDAEKLAQDHLDNPSDEKTQALGLNVPSVAIEMKTGGLPRAYNQYPWLVEGQNDDHKVIFMLCPLNYKGDHLVPEHSYPIRDEDVRISDFAEIAIQNFMCGEPRATRNFEGTQTPADFDAAEHSYREDGIQGHQYKAFIAAGRSLHIVEDYLKRKHELERAQSQVSKAVKTIASDPETKSALGLTEDGVKDIQVHIRLDDNGKTEIWISGQTGQRPSHINKNTTLAFKDNAHFAVTDFDGYAYKVEPQKDTPEGKALQKLFERMHSAPNMGQYWQLHNPTAPENLRGEFHSQSKAGAKAPKLESHGGVYYLVYLIDETADKDACNPPDSIPVNIKEYLWRQSDEHDKQRGIKPPPPPEELSYMQPVKPSTPKP